MTETDCDLLPYDILVLETTTYGHVLNVTETVVNPNVHKQMDWTELSQLFENSIFNLFAEMRMK